MGLAFMGLGLDESSMALSKKSLQDLIIAVSIAFTYIVSLCIEVLDIPAFDNSDGVFRWDLSFFVFSSIWEAAVYWIFFVLM